MSVAYIKSLLCDPTQLSHVLLLPADLPYNISAISSLLCHSTSNGALDQLLANFDITFVNLVGIVFQNPLPFVSIELLYIIVLTSGYLQRHFVVCILAVKPQLDIPGHGVA
jgi:hypothetical protein